MTSFKSVLRNPVARLRRALGEPAVAAPAQVPAANAPLAPPDAQTGLQWFHSHAFPQGDGVTGVKPLYCVQTEAEVVFKHPVAGKSVLDVGAWDGFFSFEAERRGASRVLATDHFCWSGPGWGTKAGFDYAHGRFGSKVESQDIDVLDISPQTVGRFDVVMMLGVFYHLKDPLRGVEAVASVADEMVIVETETVLDDFDEPVMRYYLGNEMAGDPTNYWAPNKRCLEQMFREFGFSRFEFTDNPFVPQSRERGRLFMHAWR